MKSFTIYVENEQLYTKDIANRIELDSSIWEYTEITLFAISNTFFEGQAIKWFFG